MENLVVYVRHAESESNAIIHESRKNNEKQLTDSQEDKINSYHDPDITSLGVRQSMQTAIYLINKIKLLKKTSVTVWLSPFQRAQDTGKYFIDLCKDEGLKIKVSIIKELQEYTSSKKILSNEQKSIGIINHETLDMFFDQIMKFNDDYLKKELTDQNEDSILIVFGHSMFFSTLMSYHVIHELYKPVDIPSLRLPNCSISCERYLADENKWKSYVIANVSHLSSDLVTGNHVPFGIN